MPTDSQLARLHVLETFRWLDGHAFLTPVFRDAPTLSSLGPALAEPFRDQGVTAVVSPEARGLLLGSLCAVELGVGFVAARKAGAPRPGDRVQVTSEPDWRGRRVTFEVARVLDATDRVLLVDDWIETGSQASAIRDAIGQMGATLIGMSVIVDQAPATVRSALGVVGLLRHDELPPSADQADDP
jgi:adenine phosphoribosyltransferase